MYVLSIKVPIRKKSGNLFNDPRISHILHRLLLHFVTPCVIFSECRRGEYSFKIFGFSLAFNDFRCALYFFDFVIVFKFF